MPDRIIHTQKAPAAIGPYSQAVIAGGMLYTSGQLGLDPETGTMQDGVEAQTRQCLQNLQAILEEARLEKTDVVKTIVYIKNMDDFATVNKIYASFFGDHKPARSCVEVSGMAKGGLVEIEAVAQCGRRCC